MACRQGKARPASAMRQYGRLRSAVIAAWMASWMAAVFPLASPCGAGEAPVVLHVDDDAPEDGDGLTWATAFTHLRDALPEDINVVYRETVDALKEFAMASIASGDAVMIKSSKGTGCGRIVTALLDAYPEFSGAEQTQ